jgi:hypothetical protein
MSDMADFVNDQGRDDMGPTEAEDYLDMTDDELRKETAACRSAKLKSIRAWPHPLSDKQRYCLAAWVAKRDLKYA